MIDPKDIQLPKDMSKQMGGAWRKGYAAFLNKKAKATCPYTGFTRTVRQFARAWKTGWDAAESESITK